MFLFYEKDENFHQYNSQNLNLYQVFYSYKYLVQLQQHNHNFLKQREHKNDDNIRLDIDVHMVVYLNQKSL